jgi:NRPS condensation-like uncharacterized protein
MAAEKQFFQTSISDELAYLFEQSTQDSLTYGFTLTLEGEVHTGAVRGALDACLNLYPKYKCILVNNYPSYKRWFRYRWEYQDFTSKDILEEIEDLDPEENSKDALSYFRNYHFSHSIDITREGPLKVMLIRQPRCEHLLFFVHHAASDGIGFLFFLQSFIKFYEELFYHHTIEDKASPLFESISQPEKRFPKEHSSLRSYYNYLKHLSLLQRDPPAQLQSEKGEEDSAKQLPVTARELTPLELEHIRTTAKKYRTTINHYLLASMFVTIKKWNEQWDNNAERIYINVPVNLRAPEDCTLGNIMSGFNISFRPGEIEARDKLLPLVREEQASAIKHDIARTNVNITWLLKPLLLSVKKLIFKHRGHKFYPTFTLSNMGIGHFNPQHKDEAGFQYLGPARISRVNAIAYPFIWPQLVVLTYNNRMTMSLSVSRSHFSLKGAEQFLDSYIQELTK